MSETAVNLFEADASDMDAGDMAEALVRSGDCYPTPADDGTWELLCNCNDIFYWACADAEPVKPSDIATLYTLVRDNRHWGAVHWCALKRQMRPQVPVMDSMRKSGGWTPAMEALPPRSKADCCWAGCCKEHTEPVP